MLSSQSSDSNNIHAVAELQDNDVLCGRSKKAGNWPGNIRFRYLVKAWAEKYDLSADPHSRDIIANKVLASIRDSGGRFLQLQEESTNDDDPNRWVKVAEATVRTKVKQALRDVTKTSRSKRKRSSELALRSMDVDDLNPRPIEEMVRSASASPFIDPTLNLDLEPRPIEEMVRSASMVDSASDILPLHHQMLRRQHSMPIVGQHQYQLPLTVIPHAAEARGPFTMYPPSQQQQQQHHQQLPADLMSIWRLQQDNASRRVAGHMEYESPMERLLHDPHSSLTISGRCIPAFQSSNSSVIAKSSADLFDEAIQEQLVVDEVRSGLSEGDHPPLKCSEVDDDESSEDHKPSANSSRQSSF